MADDVGIVAGEKLLVKVDIADNDTFVHPCLINTTRGISFKANTTDTEVANCADQSLPAKIVRKVKSIDMTVTGSGKVDATSVLAYLQWFASATPKAVEIVQDLDGASGGWTVTADMILSQFDLKGARGDTQDVDITLVPAGTFAIAANA